MSHSDHFSIWQSAVDKGINRAQNELLTTQELHKLLGDLCKMEGSPLQGIEATITQCKVKCILPPAGDCNGEDPTTLSDRLTTTDEVNASVTIRAWAKGGRAVSMSQWYSKVLSLFSAVWLAEIRGGNKGLIDFRTPVIKSRLLRTIGTLQDGREDDVFFVYIDLDDFKKINDDLGHHIGDEALEHVCACIQKISDQATIIGSRNGGDEFSLLVIGTPIVLLLDLLDQLNTNVRAKSFGEGHYVVGMTAGIARIASTHTLEALDDALKEAEQATKDLTAGGKKRGTVSISSMAAGPVTALDPTTYIKLGAVIARIGQAQAHPFANTILNVVSSQAASNINDGTITSDFGAQINQVLKWLGVRFTGDCHEENLFGEEYATSILGAIEVAIALYHGCIRALAITRSPVITAVPRFSLSYSADGTEAALLVDGAVIWGKCKENLKLDLGSSILVDCGFQDFMSTTVAFQVGFQTRIQSPSGRLLPTQLFSEVVVVDDRPKIGGGLPDFWQAGIANIISAVGANPNFNMLLLVGDPANAPETTKRIKGEVQSNSDELAVITALPKEVIKSCLNSLKECVKCENDSAQILELLYSSVLRLSHWKTTEKRRVNEKIPKLKRTLDVEPIALGALDGVQCETAAQAYPAIVEIMRTGEAASMTYDDASQPLREIVGFKLVLANPTQDAIPDYWTDQEDAFKEYAKLVLLNDDGVISKSFHRDGQYDAFIEQLASYCDPECSRKSTRRAILIVDNVLDNAKLRPLGLVSVWAAPRHHVGGCSVEFCFVWRTVEALVGLPYSLFGSIELAQAVVDQIKNDLHARFGTQLRLTVGRLTYLALSLHMRVDTFHRRIAKRIADAASV